LGGKKRESCISRLAITQNLISILYKFSIASIPEGIGEINKVFISADSFYISFGFP